MRQFTVRLWVHPVQNTTAHQGTFAAPNALNAIGQACLHFGVATHTIVQIAVAEQRPDEFEPVVHPPGHDGG